MSGVRSEMNTLSLPEEESVVWAALPHSVEVDSISPNQKNVLIQLPTGCITTLGNFFSIN